MLGEIDVRHSLVGFAAAIAIIAVLLWVVGFGDVAEAFALVRPWAFASVAGVALLWLLAWSLGLRTVLSALDVDVSVTGAYLIQAAVQFTNNVTPFGQAGGEPISALLISRSADAEYETSLAGIASVDAIHFLPSIGFAIVGLSYYGVVTTLGPRLLQAAAVVAVLIAALVIAGYVVWRHHHRIEEITTAVLTPMLHTVGRALPFLSAPSHENIQSRAQGFYRDLRRLADRPDRLAVALFFSAAGWLCMVGSLWLSLYGVGHAVPFAAVLVIVPLGAVASIAPLPGGLGGVETVLVILLVPLTGVSPAVAGAAVLVHRTATYWLPVGLGGVSAAFLGSGFRFGRPQP